jgi:large subunit ribosomal protein L24
MNIRKGDTVVVITGDSRDHGKKGRVLAVYPKKKRLLVEGVNYVQRHTRPSQQNQQGGIVQKEAPVHISNVMPWCDSAGKPSRIIVKREEDGTRKRVFKINGETVKDND